MEKGEGRPPKKIKSKKQDFGPLSVDPYPPTIKREVLIRDNFDFFLPPTLLIEKGTFLKKNSAPKHIYSNFKRDKIGVKMISTLFTLTYYLEDTIMETKCK